ncbi:hypothetical protein ACGFX4_37830 [Kitasatospora sp. NPDC048365]|uniref:hypothetical protein n=1 Tax=Kitasatospora sp. NPDC048365 TaxID=3364050 RepID=UPI003721AD57
MTDSATPPIPPPDPSEPAVLPSFPTAQLARGRPCIGECLSFAAAWAQAGIQHDARYEDGCSRCDEWCCIQCGRQEVPGHPDICGDCVEDNTWEPELDGCPRPCSHPRCATSDTA